MQFNKALVTLFRYEFDFFRAEWLRWNELQYVTAGVSWSCSWCLGLARPGRLQYNSASSNSSLPHSCDRQTDTRTDRHKNIPLFVSKGDTHFKLSSRLKRMYQIIMKQVPPMKETDSYPHMPILHPLIACQFVQFWASGGAKFPKIGEPLPRMPWNHRAKFDAASFIQAGEICNRTNKKTNKQTVNSIPTPCL